MAILPKPWAYVWMGSPDETNPIMVDYLTRFHGIPIGRLTESKPYEKFRPPDSTEKLCRFTRPPLVGICTAV